MTLKWASAEADHTEVYHADGVNMWRDWLPPPIKIGLEGASAGDRIDVRTENGLSDYFERSGETVKLKSAQFNGRTSPDKTIAPRMGRFYPKGLLTGMPGIFSANREPFRCVDIDNRHLHVDLNHPLSGRGFDLSATVGEIVPKQGERGGESIDWLGRLGNGPGMQARWKGVPTDYRSDNPFERQNSEADAIFYSNPRFTHHLDARAREALRDFYGTHIEDGMRVLDLMSSWESHIPGTAQLERFAGLGLNRAELQRNPMLSEYVVQDLNEMPLLPYETSAFDAVLCTVSVEYLTDPLAVFDEVARILSPGGIFLITFSNRWFPPKVIKIWKELHEFERIGLVIDHFIGSGRYDSIQSFSLRGLPRPVEDKYHNQFKLSDPIFAVWARKEG
jgi:hypothetical protein